MEPNLDLLTREGDLGGVRHEMKIDENSLVHLMSVLSGLYSDPESAILREYLTNALDSHIEAGVSDPVLLSLPNGLSPYLIIQDFGIGMDEEDIINIYRNYGASTKRTSNTQTGMLGLGSKSALTYTDQFTLVGIKAGIRTVVAISKDEHGAGVMDVVSVSPTTERNGVTIKIPVNKYHSFASKAAQFLKYWKPGTVLVNGVEPKYFEGTEVAPGIFMTEESNDVIVMGNVPYPVSDGFKVQVAPYYRRFGIVSFSSMGSVNFTPSREELNKDTVRTKTEIARIGREFDKHFIQKYTNEINNAPTHSDAIRIRDEWSEKVGSIPAKVQYKGEDIPLTFDIRSPHPNQYAALVCQTYVGASGGGFVKALTVKDMQRAVLVTHMDTNTILKFTSAQRAKMRHFIKENDLEAGSIFVGIPHDEIPGAPWVVPQHVMTYDELKKIRVPKDTTPKIVNPPRAKYDVLNDIGNIVQSNDIDTTKTIYYISPTEAARNRPLARRDQQEINYRNLAIYVKNATIVVIAMNRFDKFRRDYPTALPLAKYIDERWNKAQENLDDEAMAYLTRNNLDMSYFSNVPIDKVEDDEVRSYMKTLRRQDRPKVLEEYDIANALRQSVGLNRPAPEFQERSSIVRERFPLLRSASYASGEHLAFYINSITAQEGK